MKIDYSTQLFFGHQIKKSDKISLFTRKNKINGSHNFFSSRIRNLKSVWENIIKDNLVNNKRIVVPLSGGLDSRLILAGLLKYYSPKEIYTYTFGPENSLDFRIGNLIAKKFGTTHLAHAITIDDFSLKKEIFWAKTLNIPISLFYHPPINIVNEFINDNIWFGFMGDPLAGSHLDLKLNNFEESINKFFLKYGLLNINMAKKYQINTTFIESKIRETIDPSIPINIFENIDFSIRQSQFIKPHVVFSKLYTLPFVDERWIEEMLIIPNKYRNNESYYRQFLINAYPKIFSYPCKNNYGYPLSSKRSIFYRIKNKFFINNKKADFLNYIDYDSLLKTDNSFSHFVKDLIQDQNIIDHKMVLDDYNMGKLKSSFILNLASICILKNIGIIK